MGSNIFDELEIYRRLSRFLFSQENSGADNLEIVNELKRSFFYVESQVTYRRVSTADDETL